MITSLFELPITPDIFIEIFEGYQDEFRSVSLLPGVEKLISHLYENHVPIAIATSAITETFKIKSSNHQNLFKKFNLFICGDDPKIKRGKPAPDIFLEAAERLALEVSKTDFFTHVPDDVLVFEDSINGVKAARAAGFDVVWVPDSRSDPLMFKDDLGVHYLPSLEHFDPTHWGLPPFAHKN